MSKRAMEATWKAYPNDDDDPNVDLLGEGYYKGYEQAEKDLALTWKDIAKIVILADTVLDGHEDEWKKLGPEKYYSEVLRLYNERKE